MKAATIHELKNELNITAPQKLLDLCLRLAKYKKENKELLTYLLFESNDEPAYVKSVEALIDEQFIELPKANLYFTKKSLRKILRITNKHIKYTGSKQAEVDLLLYFCSKLLHSGIAIRKSTALINLYEQQVKKINTAIATFHEDLQHDYLRELAKLGTTW